MTSITSEKVYELSNQIFDLAISPSILLLEALLFLGLSELRNVAAEADRKVLDLGSATGADIA